MRSINRTRPHTTMANRAGRRLVTRGPVPAPRSAGPVRVTNDQIPARRPSPQLIADGVMASYIHDISQRGRPSVPAAKNDAQLPTPDR